MIVKAPTVGKMPTNGRTADPRYASLFYDITSPHKGRPEFATPDAYLDDVENCLATGAVPWPPATVGELMAVATAYPDLCRKHGWWPSQAICSDLGIEPSLIAERQPWSEAEKVRFIVTLYADSEFAQAVHNAIGGPAGE